MSVLLSRRAHATVMSLPRFIVLTGPPGIGKTTVVKRVYELLAQSGTKVCGFYTEELRESGCRIGFDVVTTNGKRAPLARLRNLSKRTTGPSVGKYTVCVRSFEEIALDSLKQPAEVVILDEVGKMELFSKPFQDSVRQLFCRSNTCILVSVPIAKGNSVPLVEEVKSYQNSQLITVDHENRDRLPDQILSVIRNGIVE